MHARTLSLAFLVVGLMAASASPSYAQIYGANNFFGGHSDNPNGPTVSPYLNLLQTNSQGLSSYQTLVKPLVDQQNAIQRQGDSLQRLQSQVNNQAYAPGGKSGNQGTGHVTRYFNYSHYYNMPNPQRR